MSGQDAIYEQIAHDVWTWINEFVTVNNEFYQYKFAPCPYARQAVSAKTVDVKVWRAGDVRPFIKEHAIGMRDSPKLTTRVMVFPPRIRFQWGISEYVETLNVELVPSNVFLNPGVAKTTKSRYPRSSAKDPYFIVVANSLDAVLSGSDALMKTNFYDGWPREHYELVVERRARMARKYRGK